MKRDVEKPNLLDVAGVAFALNKPVDSVRRMLQRGHLPGALKLGRQWRVRRDTLEQWINDQVIQN